MPECQDSCYMEPRITALEKDSERNQSTHKEFFNRFEDMKTALAVNDVKFAQILKDTADIKASQQKVEAVVQQIREKPAKRWDSIVDKIIWCVLAAVIAFLLAKIGL